MANNAVIELAITFLNSFRSHNPTISLCLIPYDDCFDRIEELSKIYSFSVFGNTCALETCDTISERFHGRCIGAYRKFVAWEGEFDEFTYIDVDTVVLESIDFSFKNLSFCKIFTSHSNITHIRKWVWKDSIYSKDMLSQSQIEYSANTGFFVSTKKILSLPYVLSKVEEALQLKDHMELSCMEQPFLNYVIVTSEHTYSSLWVFYITGQNRSVKLEWWAGSPNGVVDGGKFFVPNSPTYFLVHWAGVWREDNGSLMKIPYKDLWEYYRHLIPNRLD